MSEERPGWVRVIEEWIDELKSRVDSLESEIQNIRRDLYKYISLTLTYTDVISITRSTTVLAGVASVPLSLIKKCIQGWKEIGNKSAEILGEVPWEDIQRGMHMMLVAARASDIPFDTIAASLVEVFGKDAKNAVRIEDIIKSYGTENANKWKRLIGI